MEKEKVMDELISRSAAIDAIKENMPDELAATASDLKIGYTCGMAQACVVLKGMPSAQPEIIRCKDCNHYSRPWYCEAWNNSPGFPAVSDDMFCSMAERRTDGFDRQTGAT